MGKSNHNLDIIDVAKFFMAILVMTIHINTGLTIGKHDFISNGIARIAVPFYFITSGFFYFKKKESLLIYTLINTLKRISFLFIGWTAVYGIYFFFSEYIYSDKPIINELLFLKRHIFLNPYAHLWYLPALMIGIVITWIFFKLNLKKNCHFHKYCTLYYWSFWRFLLLFSNRKFIY